MWRDNEQTSKQTKSYSADGLWKAEMSHSEKHQKILSKQTNTGIAKVHMKHVLSHKKNNRKGRRKHHMQFLSQEMDHNSIHGPPHKSKPPPLVRTRGPIFTGNRFIFVNIIFSGKRFIFHHNYCPHIYT